MQLVDEQTICGDDYVSQQFDDSLLYGCEIIATMLLSNFDAVELARDMLDDCGGTV